MKRSIFCEKTFLLWKNILLWQTSFGEKIVKFFCWKKCLGHYCHYSHKDRPINQPTNRRLGLLWAANKLFITSNMVMPNSSNSKCLRHSNILSLGKGSKAVMGVGIFVFSFVSFMYLYNAVQYSLVQCTPLSCSAAQVGAVQCSMQCSEVSCQSAILSVVD